MGSWLMVALSKALANGRCDIRAGYDAAERLVVGCGREAIWLSIGRKSPSRSTSGPMMTYIGTYDWRSSRLSPILALLQRVMRCLFRNNPWNQSNWTMSPLGPP